MSELTTTFQLPYPDLTDAPNIPSDMAALANGIDGTFGSILGLHACYLYRSAGDGDTSGFTSSSVGQVNYPSVLFDTDNYHSGDTHRIIVPTGLGGSYLFGATVRWTASGSGHFREAFIDINGDGVRRANAQAVNPDGTNGPCLNIVGFAQLNDGDYLACNVQQDSGGTLSVHQLGQTPNFWAIRLPTP